MHIRKIRSFVLVAQLGSISAAARAARLAQPAVSQHLKALEDEFGVRLFDRLRRGMVLTETGKSLLAHAVQIVSHYDAAKSEVQATQEIPQGGVVLGLPTTVAATVSARLIRRLLAKYPQVQLRIVEAMSGHLREWVDTGRVDLAVLFEAINAEQSDGEVLLIEALYLVSSGGDSRFANKETVYAATLPELPLIVPGAPHSLRRLINRFAADNGLTLNIRLELDATAATRELVSVDHAYTILSLPPIRNDVVSGRLRASRIVSPNFERRLVLCRSPVHQYSLAFQAVRNELVAILTEMKEEGGWTPVTTAASA
jgi:LysR family nitrogen assimilation transcriptional regulator